MLHGPANLAATPPEPWTSAQWSASIGTALLLFAGLGIAMAATRSRGWSWSIRGPIALASGLVGAGLGASFWCCMTRARPAARPSETPPAPLPDEWPMPPLEVVHTPPPPPRVPAEVAHEPAQPPAQPLAAEEPVPQVVSRPQTGRELLRELAAEEAGGVGLFGVAARGNLAGLQRLVAQGIDVNAKASDNGTALQEAAGHGHVAMVEQLLALGAGIINDSDSHGNSALVRAASNGRVEVVRQLLAAGAAVRDPNRSGTSSLALLQGTCAKENSEAITQLLLDARADPNSIEEAGTALKQAVQAGNHGAVQALIAARADVNRVPTRQRTPRPVVLAAARGHTAIVQTLLQANADLNQTDPRFCGTALSEAAAAGHLTTVQVLLDHRGDPNAPGKAGRTPMQQAAHHGHAAIVELLKARGAT